jgi:hypothetical protein
LYDNVNVENRPQQSQLQLHINLRLQCSLRLMFRILLENFADLNLLDASRLGLPYSHNPLKPSLHMHTYLRRQTSLRFLFNIHARSNNLTITQSQNVLPFMPRMHHLSEGTKILHSGYYFTSTSALCIPATFKEVVYTSTNLLAQVLHFMTPFDMVWVQAVCV